MEVLGASLGRQGRRGGILALLALPRAQPSLGFFLRQLRDPGRQPQGCSHHRPPASLAGTEAFSLPSLSEPLPSNPSTAAWPLGGLPRDRLQIHPFHSHKSCHGSLLPAQCCPDSEGACSALHNTPGQITHELQAL